MVLFVLFPLPHQDLSDPEPGSGAAVWVWIKSVLIWYSINLKHSPPRADNSRANSLPILIFQHRQGKLNILRPSISSQAGDSWGVGPQASWCDRAAEVLTMIWAEHRGHTSISWNLKRKGTEDSHAAPCRTCNKPHQYFQYLNGLPAANAMARIWFTLFLCFLVWLGRIYFPHFSWD